MIPTKQGFIYCPLDTDIFHSYPMKKLRIKCKVAGMTAYLKFIAEIYGSKGYYLQIDEEVILDNAEYLGVTETEMEFIILCCCEVGFFDKVLYEKYRILTSAEIQERYIAIGLKSHRAKIEIAPEYLLMNKEEYEQAIQRKNQSTKSKQAEAETEESEKNSSKPQKEKTLFEKEEDLPIENVAETAENVAENPKNVAEKPKNVAETPKKHAEISQIKEKEIKEKEIKHPPLTPPSEKRGKGTAASPGSGGGVPSKKTDMGILPLPPNLPPAERNYDGMVEALRLRKIPVNEINDILRLSQFGLIGHPAWKAIFRVSSAPWNFRLPGRYIISEIMKNR